MTRFQDTGGTLTGNLDLVKFSINGVEITNISVASSGNANNSLASLDYLNQNYIQHGNENLLVPLAGGTMTGTLFAESLATVSGTAPEPLTSIVFGTTGSNNTLVTQGYVDDIPPIMPTSPAFYLAGFRMEYLDSTTILTGFGQASALDFTNGNPATNSVFVDVPSSWSKTTAAWSIGDGGGLVPANVTLTNNAFYGIFLLGNPNDADSFDYALDVDNTANNLRAPGSGLPPEFGVYFVRIGWIYIDSSGDIKPFIFKDNICTWETPFQDALIDITQAAGNAGQEVPVTSPLYTKSRLSSVVTRQSIGAGFCSIYLQTIYYDPLPVPALGITNGPVDYNNIIPAHNRSSGVNQQVYAPPVTTDHTTQIGVTSFTLFAQSSSDPAPTQVAIYNLGFCDYRITEL